MKLIIMAKKFKRVWKDEGIATAIGRAVHFAGNIEDRRNRRNDIKRAKNTKGNVLYINGCCVEHPIRYRVMHQMEELRLAGAVCEKVFVEDIDPAMEENFDAFIFFRCECSEKVERFIHKAKKDGKKVYFDIDDLVIDTKYTDRIPFVQEMTSLNRRVFDAGVIRTGKTLGLCDAAITTTETLAEELGKVVPAVYINRNAASKRMVECAQDAMEQKKQNSDNMIWLGYFSGSLTHNRDFEMIRPALAKILQTHQNVGLLLAGDLNVSDTLNQYGKRIIKKRTTGWQDLPKLLIQADINLAPFRDTDDSRYVGLVMPRVLGRLPYGPDTVPVRSFNYVEEVKGPDHEKYLWTNASFAFAANMVKSFVNNGWCVQIRGPQAGGAVADLPIHLYDLGTGNQVKIPSEVMIPETREFEFANLGFIPLSYYKNRDYACFFSANSAQKPALYDTADATANSRINARLPYIFLLSRIAHYLKIIQRENIGTTKDRRVLELELNTWIRTLVTEMTDPGDELQASHPLRDGKVIVEDIEDNPGFFRVRLFAVPHFQIEGMDINLSLVSQMPKAKA